MKKLSVLFVACIAVCFTACTEQKEVPTVTCDFEQNELLSSYANELIIPAFQAFNNDANALSQATTLLESNTTEANLAEAQQALLQAYTSFQATLPFMFGPAITPEFKLSDRINTFPVNAELIELNIDNHKTNASENFTTSIGLAAAEYLLFGNKKDSFSQNQILEGLQNNSNRISYLKNVSAYISLLAGNVLSEWQQSYADKFVANTGTSEGSSLSLFVNEVNFSFETLRNFKLKIPVGLFNGGVPQPEKSEGYNANAGLELLRQHATSFRAVFNGKSEKGLKAYTNCLDPGMNSTLLGDEIDSRLGAVESKIIALQGSLPDNLENNQQTIIDLVDEMQQIIPLLKREMVNYIGVRIVYTDNDGD